MGTTTLEVKKENQISIIPIGNRLKSELILRKVKMTPALARKLLGNMAENRNKNKLKLRRLKDTLRAGCWDSENGETIKIRKDGKLVDGQNRLQMVIDTNINLEMYVTLNCSDRSMESIDTGGARTLNDILKIQRIKYYNLKGTIVQSESVFLKGHPSRHTSQYSNITCYQKILEICKKNEDYLNFVCRKADFFNNKFPLITRSCYTKFYNIFYKIDKETCNDFFDQLTTMGKYTCAPISLLKDKLLKDSSTSIKKLSSVEKEALIIIVWNYYVDGEEPKILRWAPAMHKFPKLKRLDIATDLFV